MILFDPAMYEESLNARLSSGRKISNPPKRFGARLVPLFVLRLPVSVVFELYDPRTSYTRLSPMLWFHCAKPFVVNSCTTICFTLRSGTPLPTALAIGLPFIIVGMPSSLAYNHPQPLRSAFTTPNIPPTRRDVLPSTWKRKRPVMLRDHVRLFGCIPRLLPSGSSTCRPKLR